MAQLDKQTIQSLSKLSCIECTEAEQEALLEDLKKILDYVDQLQELDTTNVTSCHHVLEGIVNVMRDDIIGIPLPRSVFLANAPSHTGGLVRVPPVLKSS